MKYVPVALLWVGFIAPVASAEATDQNALSIAIVPTKVDSGSSIIERDGSFRVVFTNRSKKPVRLWSEMCELGYETLSFRVEEGLGQSSLMHKRTRHQSYWENESPQITTIPPGGDFSWKVFPSAISGTWEWKGAMEPNTGKPTKLTAIFEIKPTDAAKKHGVWTGRIMSKPVEALVVDPKLRTPHEYLWAQCPKQALRIMQADREWIKKTDENERTPLHLAARFGFHDVARWLLSHGADVNARAYNQFTPLHYAGTNVQIIKLLIAHKADLEAKDSSDNTALQHAASYYPQFDENQQDNPWREIVKTLLDAGAYYDIRSATYLNDVGRVRAILKKDPNLTRNDSGDLLCTAAKHGREQIVKVLLEYKADSNAKVQGANFMMTPLGEGIRYPAIVKMLLDAGADATVRPWTMTGPDNSPTVLHLAAMTGTVGSAKVLLEDGLGVNIRQKNGVTPLHYAAAAGQRKMVEFLLSKGANVNAVTTYGYIPLHGAAGAGDVEVVKLLLAKTADVNARGTDGYSPFHYAASAGHLDIVKLLLQSKADASARTKDGWTAMALATTKLWPPLKKYEKENCRYQAVIEAMHVHGVRLDLLAAIALGKTQAVAELLKADPSLANSEVLISPTRGGSSQTHEPALHWAVHQNQKEIVALLLDRGAKVNITDVHGYTALHTAAFWGWEEITQLLIQRKIDVNLAGKNGWTPLHESVRLQTTGVAKLLLEAGAKVDAKDADGQTPLAMAEKAEEEEMIQLLKKYRNKK